MTDERELIYHHPPVVTPERQTAWDLWKDNYFAVCVQGWIDEGASRKDMEQAATVVYYDLARVDDIEWMPLGLAAMHQVSANLGVANNPTTDEERTAFVNSLRTVKTSTLHERTLAMAYQLGITMLQAEDIVQRMPANDEPDRAHAGETALYRHFDEAGRLLYVGIAKEPGKRGEQHRYHSKWHRFMADTSVEWFPTRAAAALAERAAIADEAPIFNQTHNKKNRDAAVNYLFEQIDSFSDGSDVWAGGESA